jgi:3'-5' exonuclease
MICYFDIETLPCNDSALIADIHAKVSPPKTLKKAESIAAWWKDEGEAAKAEAVANTSFDGAFGRVCVISCAFDDENPISFYGDDEPAILDGFYSVLSDRLSRSIHGGEINLPAVFCGHYITGFDLPFLKHRSIINKVRPNAAILKAMNAKPWDSCIADTLLMWSGDPHKRGSMDKLCKVFGIPGKGDFDGSQVASTWPVDPQKVISYCEDDVIRTRAIYKRLTFNF